MKLELDLTQNQYSSLLSAIAFTVNRFTQINSSYEQETKDDLLEIQKQLIKNRSPKFQELTLMLNSIEAQHDNR